MSEEKRFVKNKKVLALSISLVVICGLAGVLGISLVLTVDKRDELTGDYNKLLNDFNELNDQYFILTGEHIELENDYEALQIAYEALQIAYNYITETIQQSILPVQYSIFAEAVRRYYMPQYINDDLTIKEQYMGYTEFCRDMILHDSRQYNAFSEVSDAFSDALRFGSDTMYLAHYIMFWTFQNQFSLWGIDLTSNELWNIDRIVDQCIDEIDYEYDSDITDGQTYFDGDYIKFPVETAFRTFGDCEDQAILCAAYLESCGFETTIAIFHDPNHPTYGEFYHGVPLVHIEDTSAFNSLYGNILWNLGGIDPYIGYTWCWLDTTWDVPFGTEPSWLTDYGGSISWDIASIAICDIDGAVGENIGIEYSIPT